MFTRKLFIRDVIRSELRHKVRMPHMREFSTRARHTPMTITHDRRSARAIWHQLFERPHGITNAVRREG
eukprot:3507045-Alexandrium_andersonii.AAC.1